MHACAVLVVEDDIDIRETTVEALTDHGYDVLSAGNGREALETLRRSAVLPCVILLDLMMPIMNGKEFRREQVRDATLAHIPVVVVSAFADAAKEARQLGAVDCLEKPLTLAVLLATAKRYCAPK
jgi:CheY-like chemotaxis protein